MRILVLGGTNFIGPPVVSRLHAQGHAVAVFHRGHHEADLPEGVEHIHSEQAGFPITSFPAEVTTWTPDVVVHMVAMGADDAQAAVRAFRSVAQRLVMISSGDVYRAYGVLQGTEPGALEPLPLREDSPLREKLYPYRARAKNAQHWVYRYEKILAEQAVLSDPDLPGTVLRLPKVYGPRDSSRRLFPYLKRMMDGRPAIVLQEGQVHWRWTQGYVENVAAAIALAVTDERATGQIYNIGEEVTPTEGEWAAALGQAAGWPGRVVAAPRELLPPSMQLPYRFEQDLVMDSSKIRRDLGYTEPVPLAQALLHTVEWERAMLPEQMEASQMNYRAEDQVLRLLGEA